MSGVCGVGAGISAGLVSGSEKKKVLIGLDIDETLKITKLYEVDEPWIGGLEGVQLWLDGFQDLVQRANEAGVELHFVVVTNKSGPDDLVVHVMRKFSHLLDLNHPYPHIVKDGSGEDLLHVCAQTTDAEGPGGKVIYKPVDSLLNGAVLPVLIGAAQCAPYRLMPDLSHSPKVIIFYPPLSVGDEQPRRPIMWKPEIYKGFKTKADAMKKIADEHGIKPDDCYLIDNNAVNLQEVSDAGMNAVSAEHFDFLRGSSVPLVEKKKSMGTLQSWYDGENKERALEGIRLIFQDLLKQLEKYFLPKGVAASVGAGSSLSSALSSPTNSVGSSVSAASFESELSEIDLDKADEAWPARSHGPSQVFYEILCGHGITNSELAENVCVQALGIFAR